MEKRNVIESGRTPDIEKQARVDEVEKDAVGLFSKSAKSDRKKKTADPEE